MTSQHTTAASATDLSVREMELLQSADRSDAVSGPAYPHQRGCIQAKLARKGLLKLDWGTTTYSLYKITDKGHELVTSQDAPAPADLLLAAVRTLETSPYDAAAMRVVSHSLLVDVEAARTTVRDEYAAEAMKGVA